MILLKTISQKSAYLTDHNIAFMETILKLLWCPTNFEFFCFHKLWEGNVTSAQRCGAPVLLTAVWCALSATGWGLRVSSINMTLIASCQRSREWRLVSWKHTLLPATCGLESWNPQWGAHLSLPPWQKFHFLSFSQFLMIICF